MSRNRDFRSYDSSSRQFSRGDDDWERKNETFQMLKNQLRELEQERYSIRSQLNRLNHPLVQYKVEVPVHQKAVDLELLIQRREDINNQYVESYRRSLFKLRKSSSSPLIHPAVAVEPENPVETTQYEVLRLKAERAKMRLDLKRFRSGLPITSSREPLPVGENELDAEIAPHADETLGMAESSENLGPSVEPHEAEETRDLPIEHEDLFADPSAPLADDAGTDIDLSAFWCDLCSVQCDSQHVFDMHCNSRKHQKAVEQQNMLDQKESLTEGVSVDEPRFEGLINRLPGTTFTLSEIWKISKELPHCPSLISFCQFCRQQSRFFAETTLDQVVSQWMGLTQDDRESLSANDAILNELAEKEWLAEFVSAGTSKAPRWNAIGWARQQEYFRRAEEKLASL